MPSSIVQKAAYGRVYTFTVDSGVTNGEDVTIYLLSSSTKDRKKPIIKTGAMVEGDGNFTLDFSISDTDLTTLFASGALNNTVDVGIYKTDGTSIYKSAFSLSNPNNGNYDTYLKPEISNVSLMNNDKKVTLTFNVSVLGVGAGVVNDPDNAVISLQYLIQDLDSSGVTLKTANIVTAPTDPAANIYGHDNITADYFYKTSGDGRTGEFTLIISDLVNGRVYESSLQVKNGAGLSVATDSIQLMPNARPNAVTDIKIDTIRLVGDVIDSSHVRITGKWIDNDAYSYKSYDIVNDVKTFRQDASGSWAKIRIGTAEDISNAQFVYNVSDVGMNVAQKFVEIQLTNHDLEHATFSPNGYALNETIHLTKWANYSALIVDGVDLKLQVVQNNTAESISNGSLTLADAADLQPMQGHLADNATTAYIQTEPELNSINVNVDVETGAQRFYFNGQILSQDDNGARLTVTNGSTTIINAGSVTVDGIYVDEQNIQQSYIEIYTDRVITATLSVPDRNNLYSGGAAHTYTAEVTFTTSKFKLPTNNSTFTFTGNLGHSDPYLHTKLTSVSNENDNLFDSDSAANKVTWELFDNSYLENVLEYANYSAVGSNVDIAREGGFDVTASYYLKITKHCELDTEIVAYYNQHNANLGINDILTEDVVSVEKGPIYWMQNPELSEILVSVDVTTGAQTFYFNGQIASTSDTDAKLTVTNGSTTILSNFPVVLTGATIQEKFVDQTYSQIVTDRVITATLTQQDRNGTLNGGSAYTYVATKTFTTSKFKLPTYKSEFTFTGNLGHSDPYLHTVLTDVSNESLNLFDSDSAASNVTWELFDNAGLENALENANYSTVGSNVNIVHEFDVAKEYHLKITKHCEVNSLIVSYYNLHGAELSPTTHDVVSVKKGPIYWMQNPALDDILVDVDVATGKQTFYFNGKIESKDATDAKLTVTNGSTTILSNFPVSMVESSINTQEKVVDQTYGQIVTDNVITATLTQQDRNGTLNGGSAYTYSAEVTFTTYKFKTPAAPSATLAKNEVGNDRIFKATLTDANANYGYDITTLTAQISSSSSAAGLLADCSGTFDLDVEQPNQASTNQPLDLTRAADFTVDDAYWMDVTKSYRLNDTVYMRYDDATKSVQLAQSGDIHMSPYAGPVYYMGNPEIVDISITSNRYITISAETHGTTLTEDDAFTLVLVAKDGLAGYATGVLRGPMGTTVRTNAQSVTRTTHTNENDEVSFIFDLNGVGINANASCIGIVDVTNGHSAVSLFNFPNVTAGSLTANYNSPTV